jgi:hypothetical protein
MDGREPDETVWPQSKQQRHIMTQHFTTADGVIVVLDLVTKTITMDGVEQRIDDFESSAKFVFDQHEKGTLAKISAEEVR